MNEDVKNFYYDSKSYLRKQKEKQTRVKREALDLYGLIIS